MDRPTKDATGLTDAQFAALVERLTPVLIDTIRSVKPWKQNIFIPSMDVYRVSPDTAFMPYNTCSSRDFFHPEFKRISTLIGIPEVFHRKYWEWVYVVHHITRTVAIGPGRRGLVFGVGNETLPAVFASMGARITATDAPMDVGIEWKSGDQFAGRLSEVPNGALDRAEFERLVEWRPCDMNAIDADFVDYDFCWSSCCLEHLGDLRRGLDFIINSVEKTLKVGGVAVHTTEFNLTSNDETLASGPTVLYRLRDIEEIIAELRLRGHFVEPFLIAPDSLVIDGYVDTPAYLAPPHLKLAIDGFTSTSAGLVIRRGQ